MLPLLYIACYACFQEKVGPWIHIVVYVALCMYTDEVNDEHT